jgi:hypothetical protein
LTLPLDKVLLLLNSDSPNPVYERRTNFAE